MIGRAASFACLLATLCALGGGCARSFGLEVRDCTADELAFIDVGITVAESVADTAGSQLALRHPEEDVSFDDILDQVRAARADGRIRCADHTARVDDDRRLDGITGFADMGTREIVLNTGHPIWQDAFESFLVHQAQPPPDDQTLAKRLAGCRRRPYEDARSEARSRVMSPVTAATHLVHEGAHLATGTRYPHTATNMDEVQDQPDFVTYAGILTFDAVYWQVWLPEARRIDEMYFDGE